MNTVEYQNTQICREVTNLFRSYNSSINIFNGLLFRQRDVIRFIEFYTNSKYLNGPTDELGREKPFYNIVNGMCDVENAAKDIDTSDIQAVSDDGQHYVESFLLSKDIYQWMKKARFGQTLNQMRDTHTRYGSLLVKKYIKKDEEGNEQLCIEVPEWKNLITDQVDIINSPIVECHYMTPTELLGMSSWYNVDEVIGATALNYGYSTRIPVYEVRGVFPVSFYKEVSQEEVKKGDNKKFTYQLYYLAGEYNKSPFTPTMDANNVMAIGSLTPLYWENNTEEVYKYSARKKRAGRAFGVGVVEEGEEAQVWTNDAVLKQFRAMEYTTKVIGQTASKKLRGRNMLNEVDDGQILEHEDGKPITALNLLPAGGLNQYGLLIGQWFTQYERTTSAYSAQRGEAPPSRTSFKLQNAVIGQSSSVIETIQEDLGLFITEIFEDWIMPWLGEHLSQEHILSHEFSMDELKEIDRNFATHAANDIAKEQILNGNIVTQEDFNAFIEQAGQMIKRTKATRFLKIPKNYYKKASSRITIMVTGEQRNKRASLESLLSLLKIYQANPDLINDPVLTQLFLQIVEISGAGISPVTLIAAFQEKARQQAEAAKQGQQTPTKVSQSINFKDLPPEGQEQMAAQVGIKLTPQQPATPVQPAGAEMAAPPA